MKNRIVIVDFGNGRLIAKRVKKLGRKPRVVPPFISPEEYEGTAGIIISGSPYDIRHLLPAIMNAKILELGIPILGICFGAQLITVMAGGKVETIKEMAEYGKFEMEVLKKTHFFEGLEEKETIWMSHEDSITVVPKDFIVTARTENCIAAIEHVQKPIFAVQFHPEYIRTQCGNRLFRNFLSICREWEEIIK